MTLTSGPLLESRAPTGLGATILTPSGGTTASAPSGSIWPAWTTTEVPERQGGRRVDRGLGCTMVRGPTPSEAITTSRYSYCECFLLSGSESFSACSSSSRK
eukprot:CAMPEP_0172039736 /NCGR_PEP_ID=MMETSP1041-20130122/24072_1 /TAXON_ID=464988 /ORGANISM="Hemiselmis andersenii, Strain CCMP439" /LENGTH=101 /DNA_ID=CAMNT_0012697483 /DNA_START=133 /DNA_END=435 /DNA_ORIENTATION=-